MEVLRSVVVVVHLVGMALTLGPLIAGAVAKRYEFTPVMSYGLAVSLVTGFILAMEWGGYNPNMAKLAVKMGLLLVVGAILGMGSAQAKKTGQPVPVPLYGAAIALEAAIVCVAVIW